MRHVASYCQVLSSYFICSVTKTRKGCRTQVARPVFVSDKIRDIIGGGTLAERFFKSNFMC